MKTENVSLNDCKVKIYHSTTLALDSLQIDIRCTELSQIQRLIAICGGELTVFKATVELTETLENIYWVKWSSFGNAYLSAMCDISDISYKLLIAGFSNNNCVRFHQPTIITMVDNSYFILPENRGLFTLDFSLSRGASEQVIE